MAEDPRVSEAKLAEARALWEIALIYIALGVAARVLTSTGSPQGMAAAGYRAARLLARAYYRLVRAVWSGFTIPGRGQGAGELVTLLELYQDFETLAFAAIPTSKHADTRRRMALAARNDDSALEGVVPEPEDDSLPEDRFPVDKELLERADDLIEDDDFEVDDLGDDDWPDRREIIVEEIENFREEASESEKNAREALRELEKRMRELREQERKRERELARRLREREREREQERKRSREQEAAIARSKSRAERAAAAMKVAQAGARDTMNTLARTDGRAIGWVRVPHHHSPCGWCLMLASRGIILYRSAAAARAAWHENCHCTAEPVFSRDHNFNSPQFARNRALHKMWGDIAAGKGRAGVRAWRNYFNRYWARGKNLTTVLRENARDSRPPNPSQEDTE